MTAHNLRAAVLKVALTIALSLGCVTAGAQSYDPLEVRFYNGTTNSDDNVQLLVTGTDPTDATQFNVYVSNGITTSVPNGTSVSLTNLTQFTNSSGTPYRRLYVQYTKSGSFWIGLTNQQYSTGANKGGNPSPVGPSTNQWGMAPFVQVEYAYFGSGFDTVDVTAINELSVPTWAVVLSNSASPITLQGPAGATNGTILPTVMTNLRRLPGVNWFGSATNNDTLRLVGPSSAAAPGLMMPMGAYLGSGASGTVNFLQGWPGFSAPPMSRYVSQAAFNTTNNVNAPDGNPWGMTKIHAEVGDPVTGGYFFVWDADVGYQPNTNTNATAPYADTNYVTPIPVLTNLSVGVYSNYGAYTSGATPITNFPASLGWTVRYTPDSGNPQNAIFSGYIYSAPASFIGTSNQGYVTFFSNGVANNWITNVAALASDNFYPSVLDRFLNEIAFGFAGGFVQSPVSGWTNGWQYDASGKITNNSNPGSPDVLIGRMNSTQWWDQTNGLYRANRTNDDGFYSAWGNQIFLLSPTLYSHPISDRMNYVAYTPGVPLYQAHDSTNVWLEVHFTNSVAAPAPDAARPGISSVSFATNLPVGLVYSNQGGTPVVTTNTNAGGVIVPTNHLPFGFVPTDNSTSGSAAFWQNNMILLTNSSQAPPVGQGLTNVPIPEITIAMTNTNGGGAWLSTLPYGVIATTNVDGTVTLSGELIPQVFVAPTAGGGSVSVVNYSGMGPNGASPIASIGVMTYGTNSAGELDVAVNEIPIFVNGAQPGPTVLGFDPVEGGPGTKVKIWGANFLDAAGTNKVFNAVFFSAPSGGSSPWVGATYTWPYTNPTTLAVDSNALTATVPSGAATGAILVAITNDEGIVSGVGSTNPFTVVPAPAGFWQVPSGGSYSFSGKGLGYFFTTNANWQDPDVMQLTVLNWQQSMTDPGAATTGYSSTNLPRGLHVINRWITTNNTPGVVSNSWQGYIVGRMIDRLPLVESNQFSKFYGQTSSIAAYNPVGQTNDTNFAVQLMVGGEDAPYPNSSTNTNAPVPYGVTTFSATNNLYFSNVLYYSNTPSYWEATGLPGGLALSVDLNPDGTDVQVSVVGTPTNGSGTVSATIAAVNVLSTSDPYNSSPATNYNTVTFNFGASFLTYGNWLMNYPSITGTNTNAAADPDGDGFINGNEYAFGGNPTVGTPGLLSARSADGNIEVAFIALSNAASNYTVQNTTNLSTGPWTNYAVTLSNSTDQSDIPLPEYYLRRQFVVPITPGTNNFYRLTFTNQ